MKKKNKKKTKVYLTESSYEKKEATIMKTCLFKYTENFMAKQLKLSDKKNSDIFHISAQNIDCGTH